MIWILLILAAALTVFWGWYSSELVIKLDRYPNQSTPVSYGLHYETVTFSAWDGTSLSGWFIPANPSSDTTLVVCHGWGANRSDVLGHTLFLNRRGGYNLFYFDFRNHGDSGGARTSLGPLEARDLEAALDFLKEEKPLDSHHVGLYGMSMGAAVAISVAARRPDVEGLVAESAFSSYDQVVTRYAKLFYGVPRYPLVPLTLFFTKMRLGLNPERFSPIHYIGQISPRPVLLIQGDRDVRMPPSEGERLFDRAREPKELWIVPGADHGEPAQLVSQEYEARLLEFYEKVFRRKIKTQ